MAVYIVLGVSGGSKAVVKDTTSAREARTAVSAFNSPFSRFEIERDGKWITRAELEADAKAEKH